MEELNHYLQYKIKEFNGIWVSKNSWYEKETCINLGFNCETKRYWDGEYNGLYIEIKKGKSLWLDEVIYCEIFMSDKIDDNEECKKETITVFLIPSKDKKELKILFWLIHENLYNIIFITNHS